MSVRKLKFHEQRLLRKVDFLQWKLDNNVREVKILRRYHIEKREDYSKYNSLAGAVKAIVHKLKSLPVDDPYRITMTTKLIEKLYTMGLINTKNSLADAVDITASAFCRRRLAVVMVKLHMSESIAMATKFIRHGHVRVGVDVISDPAFLVTRNMEDFVTWVDTSAIRAKINEYRDERDDYVLLGN